MLKIFTAGALTFAGDVAVDGPAPVTSVALLVLLLAERGGEAPRPWVAATLFPESRQPMNALRQALHRANKWLAPGMIVSDGATLRLGAHEIHETWPDGTPAHAQEQLVGINHPIADRWRSQRSPPIPDAPLYAVRFRQAVESLADLDPDAARAMLTSSPFLCDPLPRADVEHLLRKTEPATSLSPHAAAHAFMRAYLHYRGGTLRQTLEHYLRAHRIARRTRDYALLARAASFVMYTYLELGAMPEAQAWLEALTASDRTDAESVIVLNAKSSFFWNNARLDEAWATIEAARVQVPKTDRGARIHMTSNAAVLAAERGDLSTAQDQLAALRSLVIPGFDEHFVSTGLLAEATIARAAGDYARSIHLFQEMAAQSRKMENDPLVWYADEGRAAALGLAGRHQEAKALWNQAELRRMRHCVGLNPRIAGLKVMALGH